MTEQPLDMRTTLKGIWRRRILVGAVAAVGLCAGAAYGVMRPEIPRAATLVLLPPSPLASSGSPVRDMTTQIVLATSTPVLTPAGKSVSPPISAAKLESEVVVKSLSPQILRVQVTSARAGDAVKLANAVANSYISYVNHVLPGGANWGDAQTLQMATSALPASKFHVATEAGIGMGVGLLVGVLLALVLSGRDRRLRSRDEVADAIGVPVLASLEAKACTSVTQWQRLLDDYVPSPAVTWSLRRVLHRLGPPGAEFTQEVRVIVFAQDKAALAAGTQLATVAATLGIPTALLPGDEEVMIPLRSACAVQQRSGRRPGLITVNAAAPYSGPDEKPPLRDGHLAAEGSLKADRPELTVSLLAVDRSRPAVQPFGGANVLSVSSGFATADDLGRLALAAAEAAQAVDGILFVNPEPRDATAGSGGHEQAARRNLTRVGRSSDGERAAGRSR